MKRVVVIGAGIGGVPMALELRDLLKKTAEVMVISDSKTFHFVPSNPWVTVGWRTRKSIEVELAPMFKKKGITFVDVAARKVMPEENAVLLEDGQRIDYDYLVIATGPELAFDEIPGLGPDANTHSVCHVAHAEHAYDAWQKFSAEPGPMVVGATQGASCFGPAYEFAFIADTELRRRKIRDKVPITFVTSEPYIGHLGLGGVGDTKGMLESELRDHHIKWITNAKVKEVLPDKVIVEECNDKGEVVKTTEVPSKYTMFIPPFRGVPAVRDTGELVNPRGFVVIDKHQRNPKFNNVFSVGVCVAIPPVEVTPVPTGCPKTGYMIESMVAATARNIKQLIEGKEPDHEATWNAICLADFGDEGVAFVALPQIPPRNVNWASQGKWVHLAKIAFEKYFIRKVKKGQREPIYEKYVLKTLGIEQLKEKAG
ncbi:MAG: NAD(P)/FAD-dependent oxidoreductase [Pseudomonadales bacterium]|nr:NAD(P)/FAD-dependent oxidoreductase [Pseudomonadales bacterium]